MFDYKNRHCSEHSSDKVEISYTNSKGTIVALACLECAMRDLRSDLYESWLRNPMSDETNLNLSALMTVHDLWLD